MPAYLTIGSYFLEIAIKMWAKAEGIVIPIKKRIEKKKITDGILIQIYFGHIIHYFWS